MDEDSRQTTFKIVDRRGEEKVEESRPVNPEPPKKKREPTKDDKTEPIDFGTFILSLSTSAVLHMGLIEDPQTRKKEKNLPLARQEVDIIEMLQEKTKGNLTTQERQMMDEVLYELRMRFVQASK